ncbi:MAG: EscU/YscU/HrcU family type III secretion system export apparatus switch protein [Spirochaetes bacterium]|nr:EscU/YscU/HrcU family type III secretion system export apparatus switch protein [Spirochaetota bacterium]
MSLPTALQILRERHQAAARSRVFLDLALHAAEDEGRTYDPTESRIRKAREEDGRVFFTGELPQALEVILGFSALAMLAAYYFNTLKELVAHYLENRAGWTLVDGNFMAMFTEGTVIFMKLFLPVAGVAVVAVIASTMLQTQFHFSTKRLAPDLAKILPSPENFINKTIFSRFQWWNTAKMMIKVILVLAAGSLYLFFRHDEMVLLIHADPVASFVKTSWMTYELIAVLSVILLGVAIPDWFMQKNQFMEQLKMSFQEMKQEVREYEGDPQIKQRQQQRARDLAMRNLVETVKDADVVVRNPTHFAVALKYEVGTQSAPKVTAKGEDAMALQIIRIAEANEVPVHENRILARTLYAQAEIGDEVPTDLIRAVVEIYQNLERFKQQFGRRTAATA